jgi:hypothetical protein
MSAVAIPLMLIAPALWNGYPLLQYDTGGYLARWYEGYLVPSRSTVFGLYLHFGEDSSFWLNLGIQALATLWILQLTLRVFGMVRPWRLVGLSLVLILTTALPWLASLPRAPTAQRSRCFWGCAASAGSRGLFCARGLPCRDWCRAA